jgi:hypothetical protein
MDNVNVKFNDQTLDHIQIVHDSSGPRAAYAFFLGHDNYTHDTAGFNTHDVENFICKFYQQYNARYGTRY